MECTTEIKYFLVFCTTWKFNFYDVNLYKKQLGSRFSKTTSILTKKLRFSKKQFEKYLLTTDLILLKIAIF